MGLAIAGFHRSGTSSVTQHLAKSGLNPGIDMMDGGKFNAHGHFEDWIPVRFHNALLKSAGLDWASVTRDEIPMATDDRAFIQNYCTKRNEQNAVWGFKDPRVCHFLKDWMNVATDLKALIIYRSPAECCWSIYRRTAFQSIQGTLKDHIAKRILSEPDHALALWLTHNRKLLEVARHHPDRTLVVSHAGFANGFNVAALVQERFHLPLTPSKVKDTFDANEVRRNVDPLPVSNDVLRQEVTRVWNELQTLDQATTMTESTEEQRYFDDPSGLILMNKLLVMQNAEARKLLSTQAGKLEAASKMARKLQRWQFIFRFSPNKKYQQILEDILS